MAKPFVYIFCAMIGMITLFLTFAPMVLSTKWGTNRLVSLLNANIDGNLSIDKVQLSWIGPQEFENVSVYDEKKNTLSIQKVDINASLFQLIWHPIATHSITVSSLNATIFVKGDDKNILINDAQIKFHDDHLMITGETERDHLIGKFTIQATSKNIDLEKLIKHDFKNLKQFLKDSTNADLKIEVDIVNFPTPILDKLISIQSPSSFGIIQEALGPILNLKIEQNITSETFFSKLELISQNLLANGKGNITDFLTLSQSLAIEMTLTPTLVDMLKKSLEIDSPYHLKSHTKIHLAVNNLQIPLEILKNSLKEIDISSIALKADIALDELNLFSHTSSEDIHLKELHVQLDKLTDSTTAITEIHLNADYQNHPIQMKINGEWNQYDHYSLASLKVQSNEISSSEFVFQIDQMIELQKVSTLILNLNPNLINELLSTPGQTSLSLKQPTTMTMTFHQLKIPTSALWHLSSPHSLLQKSTLKISTTVTPFTIENTPIQESFDFNEISLILETSPNTHARSILSMQLFQNDNATGILHRLFGKHININASTDINLKDFNLTISSNLAKIALLGTVNRQNNTIIATINGDVLLTKQALGKVNGSISIHNWLHDGSIDFKKANIRSNISSHNLPTEILSLITGQHDLNPVLGTTVSTEIDTEISLQPHLQGSIFLKLDTPHLKSNLALSMDESGVLRHLNQTSEIELQLTPQSYHAIQQWIKPTHHNEFHLTNHSNVKLTLNHLKIPLHHNAAWIHGEFDALLNIDHITGMNTKSQQSISLDNINCQISSTDLKKLITIHMNATGINPDQSSSSLKLEASVNDGINDDGTLNKETLSLSLKGVMNDLSMPMIGHLLFNPLLSKQLETLMGPTANARIDVSLKSMNGPIALDAEGSHGKFQLDAVLNQGVITLQNDLQAQIKISHDLGEYILQEFIPIAEGIIHADQPMSLKIEKLGFAIPLEDASLMNISIGKASLSLGKVYFSNQSQIAKVLSLLTPINASEILVWLTPAYFSLNDGVVQLQRLDLLINDLYPIATWGHVDIGRDRVHMTIGLSDRAISKAFNLSSINQGYMLQLPVRGTLANASIDKTKAAARLSSIVAQTQGGPQGLVLGTILSIASGGMSEPKVPSPTTTPLPWGGNETPPQEPSSSHSLKQIEKSASSLLKKIFK